MADDKSDKSEQPAEEEVLVKHVDEMMEVRHDPHPAPPEGPYKPKKPEASGVPPVKGVYKLKDTDKPPIVIKLNDEDKTAGPVPESTVAPSEPAEAENLPEGPPLDDQKTDDAVDDIAAKDGDTILAVEDARTARKARAVNSQKSGWKDRLKALPKNKWTWIGLLVLLIIIFALPFTRYSILGLFIKKPVTVTVLDSKNGTPVSSAVVELGGASAKTNASGQAHLNSAIGQQDITVTKQYYETLTTGYFVGFKAAGPVSEKLVATGRLVPVSVVNSITGKPLKGAEIKLKGTTAKTDSNGRTNVALPVSSSTYAATLNLNGYNSAAVKVTVTDQVVKANTFELTPTGHVFFLSNASGNIDVIQTNLDGSGRKTILAGTGKEDQNNTTLLASRDWRYLLLEASRDGGSPALYLIDTSNGKLTEFENSGAAIQLIGWYGHNFIYELTKSSAPDSQSGKEALKSYDADHLQTNQLDQSQADGSTTTYAYQQFSNFYIDNGLVVYSTQWFTNSTDGSTVDTTGKNDTIRSVQPNGQNKKDYQNFPVDTTGYIGAQPYSPGGIYFSVYDNSKAQTTYYSYSNQSVSAASISDGTYNASYPTYLVSPNGNQTFWTQLVDGQNVLYVGDSSGNNKKDVITGSYTPYGWYTDNYVLVSKNSSQLYIVPASGASSQSPLKIADYYKPAQTFTGYGYGYGGL